MSRKLKEMDVEATDKQISKKLTDLKTYYATQRRMVEAGKPGSGAGAEDGYESSCKFYESLQFLNESLTPRETISNAYKVNNPPSEKSTKKMKQAETESLQSIVSRVRSTSWLIKSQNKQRNLTKITLFL